MNWAESLASRLKVAWAVVTNLKAAATMIPTFMRGEPIWTTPGMHNYVEQGYKKNELMWRCMQERSQAISSARMMVKSKETGEEVPDHPLYQLLQKPNHMMSEFDLWSISVIYADLTGIAYWEQVRGPMGNTVEMWPLRPDRMHPIPHTKKVISGYEYRVPGLEPILIPAENVIEFKVFDPLSLYQGVSPVGVALKALDIDISQTNYLKLFFEGGGIPPGLIKTKKKLIDADVTDIRRRWSERYGGYEKWLAPAVLDMDAEYQKTSYSFQEMGFDVLDARAEIRVAMVFMIPPVLIGARVGLDRATFANYREARTSFWEDTLMPMHKHLKDTFQRELADEEWTDVYLEWDYSNVPVLFQKNIEQRIQHRADYLAGGLQLNEYRKYMGLGPLPADTGNVRVQSLAFQIIPEGEMGQLVPLKNPVGVGDTKRKKLTKSNGKGALPENNERDSLIATSVGKVRDMLDKEKERIIDAV